MQVRLTSSNSKRTQVKDLMNDIDAELKARCNVEVDSAYRLKLHHICLQRDEVLEDVQHAEVSPLDSSDARQRQHQAMSSSTNFSCAFLQICCGTAGFW